MRHDWRRRAWGWLQRARVRVEDAGGDVTRIRMQSIGAGALGMEVDAYLVADILIDTGFSYMREPLLEVLTECEINVICCTHSHEDHTGNCAAIAADHGCVVYLRNADARWEEGELPLKPYRQIWWGQVDDFGAREMPHVVESGGRRLDVVPTPGHSRTQVALFDGTTGDVFTGDLFISPGAAAVLIWEDPWAAAESLRSVAALNPRRMFTGHGLTIENPAPRLELKAERIEEAARRSVELTAQGLPPRQIVRRVFPNGNLRDRFLEWLTSREFSRLNFVRAAVRRAPDALTR